MFREDDRVTWSLGVNGGLIIEEHSSLKKYAINKLTSRNRACQSTIGEVFSKSDGSYEAACNPSIDSAEGHSCRSLVVSILNRRRSYLAGNDRLHEMLLEPARAPSS